LEYKRAAMSAKNKLGEIKQEHWKTFCEGIDKFTNPLYIRDRMKRLKYRYNKTEKEHEYKEELVKSAETILNRYAQRWMNRCKHRHSGIQKLGGGEDTQTARLSHKAILLYFFKIRKVV
jgi:hypothetical protein